MSDKLTDEAILSFKTKTLVYASIVVLGFAIMTTFSATLLFYEFEDVKKELTSLKELHAKDDEDTNNRIDKKTYRNEVRIKEVEKSGTDNK